MLDEAGMTDDPGLLRLLAPADVSGAKIVIVGDDRQLGAVGPGGALGALLDRHQPAVHVLDENVRQDDHDERAALGELRTGDVGAAVDWYIEHDRVSTAPDRETAIREMVDAWATDALAGHEVAMYAWRRANVDDNRRARDVWALAGRLSGPYVTAPGGRCYCVGDRIVTLAPGDDGRLVTSQRGAVTAVQPHTQTFTARMDDGTLHGFTRDEMAKDRLAYGYAVTVHRSQGETVDIAQRLEDGGGRELAYVSMSRARQRSVVHVVADDLEQAREDLTRDWAAERRPRWAIDSGTPAVHPLEVERHSGVPAPMRAALRRARLEAERRAVLKAVPPDVNPELRRVNQELRSFREQRQNWRKGAASSTIRNSPGQREISSWPARRRSKPSGSPKTALPRGACDASGATRRPPGAGPNPPPRRPTSTSPSRRSPGSTSPSTSSRIAMTNSAAAPPSAPWLTEHPELGRRIRHLDNELTDLDAQAHAERELGQLIASTVATPLRPELAPEQHPAPAAGVDLGMDLGL